MLSLYKKNFKLFFIVVALIGFSVFPSMQTSAGEAKIYATVSWSDPRNPNLVNLGRDHFLLSTTNGMQVWDVENNVFELAKDWPQDTSLWSPWTRINGGTLLLAAMHNEQKVLVHKLVWWNPDTKRFITLPPLQTLQENDYVHNLVAITPKYALVCVKTWPKLKGDAYDDIPTKALLVSLDEGELKLENSPSATLQKALLAARIRGEVQGIGNLLESNSEQKSSSVIFNTKRCEWEMPNPPADMASGQRGIHHIEIKHHVLPDGRILIAHAEWRNSSWHELNAPLLWDSSANSWISIENSTEGRSSPKDFRHFQATDFVASLSLYGPKFLEFLNPKTLRWQRSAETLPDTYHPQVAPLTSGDAIVFLREEGRVFRLSRMKESESGSFAYWHPENGSLQLADGGLLLLNGSWQNRPELLKLSPKEKLIQIAPLPEQLDYLSAVELHDASVLAFGGMPLSCEPGSNREGCTKIQAQSTYRYFPKQDRWEKVPELAIRFSNARFKDFPRNDVIVHSNGDFIYLDGDNFDHLQRHDDWSPLLTKAVRWNAHSGLAPIAPLRKGRTNANLLELNDQRLVVIGGKAQQELVALEKNCTNCPDEFISLGKLDLARTTEIYDEKMGAWQSGPLAHYAGGRALKLRSGRIFKFSFANEFSANAYLTAEIADPAFTQWEKLPPFPLKNFILRHIAMVGSKIVLVPSEPSRETVVWDDEERNWRVLAPWTKENLLGVTAVDDNRVLLRYQRSYEVLELPK